MIVTTIIFGFQLRLFERQLSEASGQNFTNLNNCMWNVIITLTSVGYGDLYPKTFFGRIVGIIVCFWGVFIVSCFVVTVTNMLEFSGLENKAYELLLRLSYKTELKKDAVKVLSTAFKHRNAVNGGDPSLILSCFNNFRSDMLSFQRTASLVRSMNEMNVEEQNNYNNLKEVTNNIKRLKESQALTLSNINAVRSFLNEKVKKRNEQEKK